VRRALTGALAGASAAALAAALLQTPASGEPAAGTGPADAATAAGSSPGATGHKHGVREHRVPSDNRPDPLAAKQQALRIKALDQISRGQASVLGKRNGDGVVQVGKQYVETATRASDARPDKVLTFLVDFGDKAKAGLPRARRGPVHNTIPKPDRRWNGDATDDNSTWWRSDFSRAWYMKLLFGDGESFSNFYKAESSGKYSLDGKVSSWVKVPYRESRYGANVQGIPGNESSATLWAFIKDTGNAWYHAKRRAGWSEERIKAYLSRFDKWDRYDYDNDGNFDEPDGYIDHFQAIHAGLGEEAGAPGWTIWSHRWGAFLNLVGEAGPAGNLAGGTEIGDTGFWIRDYTTEPENGGLGVFAHEYGHDLGLDDYYDTAGGDNGTGNWTLMSGGSWMNHGLDMRPSHRAIGTTPDYVGPHEKYLLGWLDYAELKYRAGSKSLVRLGQAGRQGTNPQALKIDLPRKTYRDHYNSPHSGQWEWWSGAMDGVSNTLAGPLDLHSTSPGDTVVQTVWAWYDIEEGYDYLYLDVSTDGGSTWTTVKPDESDSLGVTGSSDGTWVQLHYDLSDWAGDRNVLRQFRYVTDSNTHGSGAFLDDLSLVVNGARCCADGVETVPDPNFTANDGWKQIKNGTDVTRPARYYLVENRQYVGYDKTLEQGPYNFGWAYTRPNWVERFPYQNGMLVWYVDNRYMDDFNTSLHPGHGWALPVDAQPSPITFADGSLLSNRRQPFDATFGLSTTDRVTFHREALRPNGHVRLMTATVPARHGVPLFDDSVRNRYWSAANPWGSVKVPGTGTRVRVLYESPTNQFLDVRVNFAG
jgi:immune inhibitor A